MVACISQNSLSVVSSIEPILHLQANNAADAGFDEILDARFWLNQVWGWLNRSAGAMRGVPDDGPTAARHRSGVDLDCMPDKKGILALHL